MKVFKRKPNLKKLFTITIPIIIVIIISIVSQSLFQKNKEETYQMVKTQKEHEVTRLVYELDGVLSYREEDNLTEEHKHLIKLAISEINKQKGVYCFLLDMNYDLVPEYNKGVNEDGTKLLNYLQDSSKLQNYINKTKNNNPDDNHFKIKKDNTEYEFYWQRIPTKNSEFYILIGESIDDIEMNSAFVLCRIFIGILNILLATSIYGNIYLLEQSKCNKCKEGCKNKK